MRLSPRAWRSGFKLEALENQKRGFGGRAGAAEPIGGGSIRVNTFAAVLLAAPAQRGYGGSDSVGEDMFVDWLLASFHHLAVFSLAAILSAEIFLTAGPIDDRLILRIARVDAWFGLVAALVVAAGVLRVFFGAKGYEYYWVNIFFWAKMALFVGVGLVSVAPTMLYIGWRRRVRADPSFRPPADEIKQLRQALYVEAGLFALIPLCAAAMARGYGM
jgi:putative membrane protein